MDVWEPVATALKEKTLTPKIIQQASMLTDNLTKKTHIDTLTEVEEKNVKPVEPGTASSAYLFRSLLEILK